jgi:hypothetical protein
MRGRRRVVLVVFSVLLVAGATGVAVLKRPGGSPDPSLAADLALARGESSLELAPATGQRLQVVSAIEQTEATPEPAPAPRKTPPAPRTPRPEKVEHRPEVVTPTDVAAAEPAPEPSQPVQEVAVEPTVSAPAPSPDHIPAPAPQRGTKRGGWWTTADVIRNAPFPINPLGSSQD